MKYVISESQINNLSYGYINTIFPNVYVNSDGSDLFVWSSKESWENSERPKFSYYGKTKELGILPNLIIELTSFFPFEYEESMDKLKYWFENKFEVPVKGIYIM